MGRIIAFLLSIVAVTFASCSSKEKRVTKDGQVVKIAYLPITHSLPLVEMEKTSKLNIELVKYGSWPELLDALNTGRVDGASVLVELAMKAKAGGIGLTAVALGHHRGNVVVVDNGISSAKELKGKTFAIPHRCSSHYILLRELLKKSGMTIDDIDIVELSPSEMPSALASGRISGFCVAEPFGAIAVSANVGKVLYQSEQLWDNSVCCAFVLHDEFLKQQPKLASQLVADYKSAANRLSDKKVALADLTTVLKQKESVLAQSLGWIDFSQLEVDSASYVQLSDKVKEYGIMENPPAYNDFVKNIK